MAKRSPAKAVRPPILPVGTMTRRAVLPALLIAAAVFAIYAPALNGGWLWDDDRYVTGNALLRSTPGLWKIWFQPGVTTDYYPLEATVTWYQWQLWGPHTFGYHLTNVVLHLLSAVLVWRLLEKFQLRLAWLGGLLFAIHPVQVESVAWIAELKNTLSLPLLLGAMGLYLDFDTTRRALPYWLAVVLFICALLCKISVVFFPVVILLYIWWKRDRITLADARSAAPFFAAALAAGLITFASGVWAKQFDGLPDGCLPAGGILGRIDLAGLAFSFYFSKVVLPIDLLPVYPLWRVDYASPAQYLPWLIWPGLFFWFWKQRQGWGRDALLGLGFFAINLAPCPGFIPAPNMGYAWVMDHFLYLPIIGLVGLFVAVLGQFHERLPSAQRPLLVANTLLMAWLAWQSHGYAALYSNSKTLWTYTLQHNAMAWPAHNNLGAAIEYEGHFDAAIAQFHQALAIKPNDFETHGNLGGAYMLTGRVPEALAEYEVAEKLKPDSARAHNNLGNALKELHRLGEAQQQYEQALKISPDYPEAADNLGIVLTQTGHPRDAIESFELAVQLNPANATSRFNLGLALAQSGRLPEAQIQFAEAIRLNPTYAEAHYNLGIVLRRSGQLSEAVAEYQAALRANPRYPEACNNLGIALYQLGRTEEAIAQFREALRLNPTYADAQNNLNRVQALHPPPP